MWTICECWVSEGLLELCTKICFSNRLSFRVHAVQFSASIWFPTWDTKKRELTTNRGKYIGYFGCPGYFTFQKQFQCFNDKCRYIFMRKKMKTSINIFMMRTLSGWAKMGWPRRPLMTGLGNSSNSSTIWRRLIVYWQI